MSTQDIARRMVALKALGDIVKDAYDAARAEMRAVMGDEGIQQLHAKLGEARIGSVSMTTPATKAAVTNGVIFTEWVKTLEPSAVTVETREVINETWQAAFVGHLLPAGAGAVTEDGEEVPGVTFSTGSPYVTTRNVDTAAILAALRAGALDTAALLALPEAPDA